MTKIILIVGILLATSYFGDTDNLLDSGTKIGKNVWFPATPADSAVSKDTVDTNSRDKRSMAVVLPMESIRADGNNNEDVIDDEDDDDDKEINRRNYKTKRCRGLPSYRKIKLYKEPEEDVVSYAIKNARSLDPSKNIILQMGEDNQVTSEESDEEEQPYLRIAAVKNPKAILKNILRSKSMQRYEESEINKDNAVLKRVKAHLRPEDCNVLALIGKRAGNIRPNKPRKFVCYYEDKNCGNDPGQMVLQAYPVWKKARPVFLNENNYGINTIPNVQQDHQFQKFVQAPIITQYSQPSVLAKSQNPMVSSQIISGILKTQSGTIPMDTRSDVQKQQFENIKSPPILQLPEQPFNIQYGVPSGKINWQQLNKMASADSAIQRNGFVGQQIKSHASVQTPFRQNCVGTSYSGNNAIDQSNEKMLSQQNPIDHKIEDEYVGTEQTIPIGNEKTWSIGRTELGKSFRNVEDCIKLYGREFCVVDATSLSQWKNAAVHQIGLDSEDGHLSTDYSDRNTLNYVSTPISANYGYHNDEQTVDSNYQYDSRNPDTQLKYTSEQPFVAQTARNKLLTGSDESYETTTTNFGYYTDHNEEQTAGSNYEYDSRNPKTQLKYISELPFIVQTARNKLLTGSDESYETTTTNFGYSTDHNEEQTAGSNYQYDSRNPDTPLEYTSEQPFIAQAARNKLLTGSDESYETTTTNFGYSTDHNEEQTAGSNYQYDSRNPDTPLEYTSEQPFIAQAARNKLLTGSDESYETTTTNFGYSTDHNEEQTAGSNYQYDSRNPDTPLEYTSEQPFIAQAARNKLLTGSDESYETTTTNFGYSTDHNEEQTAGSNYQYDSRNPDTPLEYTSEQPFVAQRAQNKIIKESDESYGTATTNFGYSTDHNEEQTAGSNYQYDSRNPDTQLKYTSEQPFIAQAARNKLLTGSDESYETTTTNFGYFTDHNQEQTAGSNYQYDSRNPDTQLKYTSEQPFIAQAARNKLLTGSDESYETTTTNFGVCSSDHNEEQTAGSNYQYDSRNPDTQLKYTSEQPFVAQTARNKIIKESDESYGTVTTDCGYSTDHNEEQTAGSNYQYDSRNPDTQLKYTSEQPFVAQTARNKILTGSDESYGTAATNFRYSTDHNQKGTAESNYQYDSRNPDTQLKYTSEQPFVAQTARNKILTGSDESYGTAATNFRYSTDHNQKGTAESNYQYDSRNSDTQLKYTSEQPFVAQTAQNKILPGSDESYETTTTNFGYFTDHNEEQTAGSNYQYDSRNPDTQLKYTSEQPFVAQTAQNKILPGSAKSYEAGTTDFEYSPENNFKQRIQEDHVQQNEIGKNSNIDTSDYYDNTGSQNSHIYQYEDNSVHNNNMKYNEQSLSHDTYGTYDTYNYTTQNYLLNEKQKPNLHSDSRHHIVDSPCRVPVTPYENDDPFYTTENNLQHYNDYSSDDKNDLKYPLISDETRESSYADNTEPYTGNRYDSVQPEYYAMNKMPKTIQHDLQAPVIIGTEIPSLTQIEPTLLEDSTYPENAIKRPLEITNNHYEQVQLSRPSYDRIPSHHYTNINYFNDQLDNHQLGKAYTAQDFGNTEYINNDYNFNNYPNFYDGRVKNIWENSEGILSPDTRNEHIASSNMLREMSEGVQEHQRPGPEWDSERFSSVDNSKKSTATDHSQIIEVTNGYSFVDNNFDKAYGMHTNDPASSTDLFINDGNDRFNPKFTDINDPQIQRQPQDILGHVPYTDSLEKFVDSTSNVLQSVEFQTNGPEGIRYFGDSMKHLDEIENSATEVTYAESTETPYGEEDSSRDLGEKYSPSISVDLTSPHSRKCFITGTGEEGSFTPLQDLVGQSLHEGSMKQSAETYTVGSKDLDLRNAGKIKSTIHAAAVNSNPSIDLPTDQESTLIRDSVGEYFEEGTRDKNTDSHDTLISVTQNSDMVNLTPTENIQSVIYGPGEKLITSNNLPKDIDMTSASDTIGKPLNQKIFKEYTDSYDTSEPVIPNTETADITIIGKSSEDNKDIVESNNRLIESAMVGNSKCSVINSEKMFTTQEQEYSPHDDNYLKATIKSVINNFATNKDNDMVGSSKNSKSTESSNSEDLLPEIISTPMLKTLFALPEVENTLTDIVKETLSKSPYETKYRSILGSESDAIKSILRDVIAEIENSLPTDYPITVEEHEFKGGHWVTEQITLMPTVPAEQRVQIPFSETVNKIILQTLKNIVTSPILGSKAASHPVVQNVIMETVKNALRKANVNTASIDDSALREVLDNLIREMKADGSSATGSLRDSFDSSASILGQSIDENTKIPMTENNCELEKWTTTDNIQTQIENPENLNSKEIFENNDKAVLLTSTDNYDEKSSILGQTVDMSDYDIPKESLLNDKKVFNHVLSTNPGINDAFSSSADSIIINDEKASQTATEAEDYKMLREFNKEEYHRVSSKSNDESLLKSVQSQIVDNTQVDESVEENVQAAHFTPNDNDYPLKSSPGSNFDKIQNNKSIQENFQAAHSNPILSSSVISKCSNVSPDRMISHTPPADISTNSEEIIDDTLTVTEYPNVAFNNEYNQHILGMTEKLPSDEDFSLKSSQGSNFDKTQIDNSMQNVQAAHSNPILSSSLISKCSNVSPNRMISHTPPADISASSEEIIDDTLTVTEYPNVAFNNEYNQHILGMTEKLPRDEDISSKSSQGSNFDKIQIDKSIQKNVQAAHSNPILSSSVRSKCSNVSPDRMISHTPPADISTNSEEIIDDTLTVTEYPNVAFNNEYNQHILGMTEKLPRDEDISSKSSQGSNFDKIQIDKSIQKNVQAAHSNPILSSSVRSKCSNVSPDRMISHTPPADISASSEEIIDDTLTVTEYPNLTFDNGNTEHVLGMTEKIPAKNYDDVASIPSTDLSNNSPAVATKTIGKVSSNSEVADINNLLEKTPIKYYSPNDRILEYKKNHLQYWNTESKTNMPLGNDIVKESVTGSDQGCRYSTVRKNSNDYYDNTDKIKKINSLQYNNNEIQKNEYMVGNNREIVTPDKDKKVNQEMIKSKTSSAILESTMNIMPNSKINDYDDTESQIENNVEQFTSDGIVGQTEPQNAIEGLKKKYMDINSDESGTEDISNEKYISSVSNKNIQSDSSFENTQEKSMFDETAVNTSLDEETSGDIEDDSKLTATQEENTFFETTVNPSSDEETFIQPEQYDESKMAPDISEEEGSRSKEHVELAEPRENKKFLEKLNNNEEVSDVSMSKMTKDISDEEISKSEEYANLESEQGEESLETLIDSKELNDLDDVSYDSAETAENVGTSNSPTFNNDDYDLAKSQEYSSELENAQGEAYEKNFKHNLEHSASQYLGASKSNTGSMKNIQMGKSTRMGIPVLESSNQNKMLKQTRKKEKMIPTKSHEIIRKTIEKTITKTTKYYGAEDSIEDTTVNSPNNEMVSATKSSCFSDSDHDLTYFGKLLPKCGKNQGNDISELTNSDLYYIGDGVRLPLTIKKLDDGSYGLSISEKVCEHFMNTRCPCCVPRDGTIVSEKRNSHEGRNLKRDLWKLSKKSCVEGERDSNEKVQDEVGKSKTRHTRSTPAVISEIQNNDEIIIPESHSTLLRSMPVQEFAKKYNLILDLAKHSVTENVQKTVTEADNNKSILDNDEGIEHEEKEDLTEIEENFSNILNKTNGNKIFDGNQTSNLVKSLIAINDAPENKRAGIVVNALKNLIEMGPTEIYAVVDGQEKKVEIMNMEHVEEDSDAAQDEEIAKYGYQKDNPILGRIKFIKRKQKEQSQHMYQQIDDNDIADKMEILKVILYWLKDVILRTPTQNKS
ncbi:uncharacterized protein LOC112494318 [Cephus cinctus]|uniref:Uncharacterized protein LOC112494318 n=1 Tax=Cephus cinctus TaxID=211228 RepID=A0AAJ7W116_CEPCN|nr:uncharacterized protein LOC112494318 [Cephus cinctus]